MQKANVGDFANIYQLLPSIYKSNTSNIILVNWLTNTIEFHIQILLCIPFITNSKYLFEFTLCSSGCPWPLSLEDQRIACARKVSLSGVVGRIRPNILANLDDHNTKSVSWDFSKTSTNNIPKSAPLSCYEKSINIKTNNSWPYYTWFFSKNCIHPL